MYSVIVKTERNAPAKQSPLTVATGFVTRFASADRKTVRNIRPNPIGTSIVEVVGYNGLVISVRGLDCLDETPLLDLKPDRTLFKPLAPPQPGDFETSRPCLMKRGR